MTIHQFGNVHKLWLDNQTGIRHWWMEDMSATDPRGRVDLQTLFGLWRADGYPSAAMLKNWYCEPGPDATQDERTIITAWLLSI